MFLQNFKKLDKFQIFNISATTRTRQINYSTFERSSIVLSFWSGEPLSPRAPFFKILVSFSRYRRFTSVPHFVGVCSNNSILLGFVALGLVVEGHGVAFFYWSKTFEKTGFRRNWNLEKKNHFLWKKISQFWRFIHYFNACAIQINLVPINLGKTKVGLAAAYWHPNSFHWHALLVLRAKNPISTPNPGFSTRGHYYHIKHLNIPHQKIVLKTVLKNMGCSQEESEIVKTSREQHKSAPYLRLKNSNRT